jgi:hypothetical protein
MARLLVSSILAWLRAPAIWAICASSPRANAVGEHHCGDENEEGEPENAPTPDGDHDHHCCGNIVGAMHHEDRTTFHANASQLHVILWYELILLPDRRIDQPPQG